MKKPHLLRLLIAAALVAAFAIAVDAGGGDSVWISPPACSGSIAECMTAGDIEGEFEMDSETNRRILAAARRKKVSYGALDRNKVPCGKKGNSYYNCQSKSKANPYKRGCVAITKCKNN